MLLLWFNDGWRCVWVLSSLSLCLELVLSLVSSSSKGSSADGISVSIATAAEDSAIETDQLLSMY